MIEEIGETYGMQLNKKRCEVMYTMQNADIHFKDGTTVTRKEEVVYLGCNLNQQTDYSKEVLKRMQVCNCLPWR